MTVFNKQALKLVLRLAPIIHPNCCKYSQLKLLCSSKKTKFFEQKGSCPALNLFISVETQWRHSGDTVQTAYHQRGCPALNLFISQWRLRLSVSTRTLAVSISVGGEGISCLQIFHPLPFPYSLTIFSEVKPSFSTYLQISHHGVGGACHVL